MSQLNIICPIFVMEITEMWIVVSSSVYSRITKIRGGVHGNRYETIRKKSIIEARFFLEQTLTVGLCHFTHAFGDLPPQQHHLLLILSWASLGFDWSSNLFAISYPSSLRHIVQNLAAFDSVDLLGFPGH